MYEPAEDSHLILSALQATIKEKKPKTMLEIGTGSGFVSISVAKEIPEIIATDIDDDSLEYAREEMRRQKIKNMTLIKSDLFENVPRRKFEVIAFNAPYLPQSDEDAYDVELYGGESGTELSREFLKQAKGFLAENGTVLLVASSHSDVKGLEDFMLEHEYEFSIAEKQHIFFEDIIVYRITGK